MYPMFNLEFCNHYGTTFYIDKEEDTVYEICNTCNKLISMRPWTVNFSGYITYSLLDKSFKELFEIKKEGVFYKAKTKSFYNGTKNNTRTTNNYMPYNKAKEEKKVPEAFFWTNIPKEER